MVSKVAREVLRRVILPHKPLLNELMGLEQGPPVLAQQVPGDPQGGHPAQQKAEQADYSLSNDSFRVALHGVSSFSPPAGGCRRKKSKRRPQPPLCLMGCRFSRSQYGSTVATRESTRDRHRTTATTAAMRFAGAWGPGAWSFACSWLCVASLTALYLRNFRMATPNRRRR